MADLTELGGHIAAALALLTAIYNSLKARKHEKRLNGTQEFFIKQALTNGEAGLLHDSVRRIEQRIADTHEALVRDRNALRGEIRRLDEAIGELQRRMT